MPSGTGRQGAQMAQLKMIKTQIIFWWVEENISYCAGGVSCGSKMAATPCAILAGLARAWLG